MWNLAFIRCPGVGNSTLDSKKYQIPLGFPLPPPSWGKALIGALLWRITIMPRTIDPCHWIIHYSAQQYFLCHWVGFHVRNLVVSHSNGQIKRINWMTSSKKGLPPDISVFELSFSFSSSARKRRNKNAIKSSFMPRTIDVMSLVHTSFRPTIFFHVIGSDFM